MEEEENLPEIRELELHEQSSRTREVQKAFLVDHGVEWKENPSQGVTALLLFPPETVYEQRYQHPKGLFQIFLLTLPDGAYFYWLEELLKEGNFLSIPDLDKEKGMGEISGFSGPGGF